MNRKLYVSTFLAISAIQPLLAMAPVRQLIEAVKRNDGVYVAQLIAQRINVNAQTEIGATALMAASALSYTDIIQTLLDAGADINTPNRDGITALMCAAHWGKKDAVAKLLEYRPHIHMQDRFGKTALIYAALRENWEIVEMLLQVNRYFSPTSLNHYTQ